MGGVERKELTYCAMAALRVELGGTGTHRDAAGTCASAPLQARELIVFPFISWLLSLIFL